MKIRLILAGCVVCSILSAGCDAPRFPFETPEQVSASRVTADDVAIYDALVLAYAEHGEILGKGSPPPEARRPLTAQEVADRTAEYPCLLYGETSPRTEAPQVAPDRWHSLSDERLPPLDVPEAVLHDFAARNQRSASLKNLHLRHLQVKLTDNTIGSPLSGAVLSLTLPGYSEARDAAVVEVGISTSGLSGGRELVFLRKVQGAWRVIAKQQTSIS